MKKSRKQFIIKAHESACSEWKANIQQEFPKLFVKEEKANGWYKDSENEWCMFFIDNKFKYGFNMMGEWVDDLDVSYSIRSTDYKATDKEVETALIKEAKKRGFKEGVSHSITNGDKGVKCIGSRFGYVDNANKLLLNNWSIFEGGKWATILETITKAQAEKELGKTIID